MSGFSADWLALREPADGRARDEGLARRAAKAVAAGSARASIVDLGCGTGSNLRALAPLLPERQSWRLVDHDPALLAAAREVLSAWAETAEPAGRGLLLQKGGRSIAVTLEQADLSGGAHSVLRGPCDLVTAAALFDLVSEGWIEAFAACLARRRLPLYTVLTYDGEDTFEPHHPLDAQVLAAFHRHMGRDKGFGPAAGPRAAAALEQAFVAAGYEVRAAPSPWVLEAPGDAGLIAAVTAGIAGAAADAGLSAPDAAVWAEARRGAGSARIGHLDLLATPR